MPKDLTSSPKVPGVDRRESSDEYYGELIREGRWRIAVCDCGLQWLVQRCTRARGPSGPRWESKYYCVTQRGLELYWPGTEPAGQVFLKCLPKTFNAWKQQSGWPS